MAENQAAEAAPKKKSKLLMMIIIAVVALGATGAGAYFLLKGDDSEAAAAAAEHPEPGEVVKLDAVTINLADGHYLKLAFALQATADAAEAPDGSKALGIAIDTYTGKEIAELSTPKGRDAAKAEFLQKVKKAYVHEEKETVMDLYLTQFVTQ
jgi:flagellar FliL protein